MKVKDRKLGLEDGRERGERWRPQPDATHTDTHNTRIEMKYASELKPSGDSPCCSEARM